MGRRPMNSARGLVVALQVNGAVIAEAIVVETRMFGMRFGLSRAMWDICRPGHLPLPPRPNPKSYSCNSKAVFAADELN